MGKVFESVAPKYDVMNDVMSVGMHRLWKDHFVSKLSPAPGISHLDVAGGTGDIAFRILKGIKSEDSYHGSVTVLDINEAMVNEGKKKADKSSISGTIPTVRDASVSALKSSYASVDASSRSCSLE